MSTEYSIVNQTYANHVAMNECSDGERASAKADHKRMGETLFSLHEDESHRVFNQTVNSINNLTEAVTELEKKAAALPTKNSLTPNYCYNSDRHHSKKPRFLFMGKLTAGSVIRLVCPACKEWQAFSAAQ